MTDTTSRERPELSVILTTDTRETIRGVLRRLHQQTAKSRIEIIMVIPRGQASSFGEGDSQGFAGFRIIEMQTIRPLRIARAVGVRASTAPLIFLGETHAYPHPEWAEALISAETRGQWGTIVCAFDNPNPRSAVSWACFLADYGSWSEGLPAAEIDTAPLFNSAYDRSALLELGDRLEIALNYDDELPTTLRRRGYRLYFAADARIDHLNIDRAKPWIRERFLTGMVVGGLRSQRWSWTRRLAYIVGSPLIPFVLSYRIFKAVRHLPIARLASAGTFPLIFLGTVIKAAGEMIGYAIAVEPQTEIEAEEYELHKMAYAAQQEV